MVMNETQEQLEARGWDFADEFIPDEPTVNNQDKTVDVTENGTIEVTPDEGFTGLGKVTVNTGVVSQSSTGFQAGVHGIHVFEPGFGDGTNYYYFFECNQLIDNLTWQDILTWGKPIYPIYSNTGFDVREVNGLVQIAPYATGDFVQLYSELSGPEWRPDLQGEVKVTDVILPTSTFFISGNVGGIGGI